jgi:hypothetical protein
LEPSIWAHGMFKGNVVGWDRLHALAALAQAAAIYER